MADFTRTNNKIPKTLSIDSFRGINLFSPVTGESTVMKNFKITPDLKLKKREGTRLLSEFDNTVRGVWYGKVINDGYALYLCSGTQIVKYYHETDTKIVLGNINAQSNGHVNIFYAYNKLYFLDGYDIYTYDGVELKPVEVYVPIKYEGMNSGGTTFQNGEAPNILTNKYICRYILNNLNVLTWNHRFPVSGVEKVFVNDIDCTNDFTVTIDPVTNYCTLQYIGARYPNTGSIYVTFIGVSGHKRAEVFTNRYHAIFGEYSLPRLFLYGGDKKNKVYYSEKFDTDNGLYVLAENYINVGEEKNAVTSVIRQFDDLMIFTEGDAWSINVPSVEKHSVYTNMIYTYSLTMINSSIGNIGYGNVKSIENNLISVAPNGLYSWAIMKVIDERNVKFVSDKLYKGMSDEFIQNAVTFNNRNDGEIWLAYDGSVWIYNFKLDTWYYYDNIYADGLFMMDNAAFYYENKVFIFDEDCYTDNGQVIEAVWESNYMDFDLPQYTKNINRMYLTVKDACNIDSVKIKSDRNIEVVFENLNNIDNMPMTFRRRMNINRCRFIKMSITSCGNADRPIIMNVKFAWVNGSEGR